MAKKEKQKSGGAPAWMATFADMCTLLLTFFIIMLSMSTTDVIKFRALLGSIKDSFGVNLDNVGDFQPIAPEELPPMKVPGQVKDPGLDKTQSGGDLFDVAEQERQALEAKAAQEAKEKADREEAAKDIQKAIEEEGMGELVQVQSGNRGIRIRVKGALMFPPGASEIRPQAQKFLDTLVQVLNKFDYYLLVEGHTDSTPISTSRFPSNWELSGDRAAAVLRYLIEKGIDPIRMTSVGMADNYPLAANDTPEGRTQNRRVEFVMTKQPFRPEID